MTRKPTCLALLSAVLVAGACKPEIPMSCKREEMSLVVFQETDYETPMCVDIHAAARRDATATSAGVDESLATSRPGVIPWTNLTFEEALLGCARAGKYLCDIGTYQVIGPARMGGLGAPEIPIRELSPTGPETDVPDQKKALFPPATTPVPLPETDASVAYWAFSRDDDDWSLYDETTHLIFGRLGTDSATLGSTYAPMFDDDFRHPLLGFRCCLDPRLDGAFEELPPDPRYVRDDLEPVPIAAPGTAGGPDAGVASNGGDGG